MGHLLETIIAVVIPVAAFSLNWLARANLKYQQSAASDFVLAIVVFDIGALAAKEVFQDQVAPQIQAEFGLLFMIYALVTGLLWGWFFLGWEARMDGLYDQPVLAGNPIKGLWRKSWAFVGAIVTVHVITFLYR